MSKIYERLLSTITPQGKKLGLVRSPKLNPVGRGLYLNGGPPGNTFYCRLFIVGIFFFLLHDEMTLAVSKDVLCFVKQSENQIVLTIGASLHYTDVEL